MTLRYSRQKLDAALNLLAEFEALSFPHADFTAAIGTLKSLLRRTNAQFTQPVSSTLATHSEMASISLISEILELLGVIANSANVRNSFEIHGPVLDLVARLLGDTNAKLIISFEWSYIPYTFPQNHPHLPSFVIIGLPASEASNALVLPVIGHEIGHSLWRNRAAESHFAPEVNAQIIQAIKGPFRTRYDKIHSQEGVTADECDQYMNLRTWSQAAADALRQVEELFSDFTGLFLFGESYLDSFEYLLSPTLSPERSAEYPSAATRASFLQAHAGKLSIPVEPDFCSRFSPESSPFDAQSNDQLQLDLADNASTALAAVIADYVFDACGTRGLQTPSRTETDVILEHFRMGVPAENTTGLGTILNAGWAAFKSQDFMLDETDAIRMSAINELVLKSVEVFEIERVT